MTSPFSQPHRFNASYEYKSNLFSGTIQYNYAIGRPFTQANGLAMDGMQTSIILEELLDQRVDDYHRVDLMLKLFPFRKNRKHSMGIYKSIIFLTGKTLLKVNILSIS